MYHQVKMWEFAYCFRREPLIAFPPCLARPVGIPDVNSQESLDDLTLSKMN